MTKDLEIHENKSAEIHNDKKKNWYDFPYLNCVSCGVQVISVLLSLFCMR